MKQPNVTVNLGKEAETRALEHLARNNFQIITRNWRTKTCEIDIIASRDNTVYLVEVRLRSSISQGDGFDSITASKLRRMHYAANKWRHYSSYNGEICLAVVSLSNNLKEIDCRVVI